VRDAAIPLVLPDPDDPDDAEPAARLLEKLRAFVTDQLDDDERALLALLLAPGVALAFPEADGEDEVVGFGVDWRATSLPDALATTLREGGLRVEGF
jgi:hypothetical protein